MNELSRHIEILLLDNDCVIVPGFGGFVAHHIPAECDEHVFRPPFRTIGFNPQLKHNDYLLAQSFVEAYDISCPEAIRRIEKEVEEIKQNIAYQGQYDFNGIGVIRLDAGERLIFTPCKAGLLTPSLYALSNLYVDELSEETTTEELLIEETTEAPSRHNVIIASMPAMKKAAAAILILILFTLSILPAGKGSTGIEQSSVVNTSYFNSSSAKQISVASLPSKQHTPAQSDKDEYIHRNLSTEAETPAASAQKLRYTIVLASMVTETGAAKFVSDLKDMGYEEAEKYGRGKSCRVIYGHYATEEEAEKELLALRKIDNTFKEGWTYKIK